jgi:hypothetical protein
MKPKIRHRRRPATAPQVDLLLPQRSGKVSIAAFCVEPDRWTARGNEDVRQFLSAV